MIKAITMLAIIGLLTIPAIAQNTGALRLGAGLAIGTEAGLDDNGSEALGVGINIGGEYFVVDQISAAVSYTHFFRSKYEFASNEISVGLSSINLDGRYYFLSGPAEVYGIAGISIATATAESKGPIFSGTRKSSDSEVGINFGAGVNFGVSDDIGANIQAIYNTPLEQPIFNLGLYYRLL